MARRHPHRPATPSEIVGILGPIGDSVIAQIVSVQPTPEEVAQAEAWLSTRDYFRRIAHDSAHGKIAKVYHILDADRRSMRSKPTPRSTKL